MGIKYTSLTKKAMMICFETHKNQKDKSGMPYVFHPFHLAEQMETEDEICTALLICGLVLLLMPELTLVTIANVIGILVIIIGAFFLIAYSFI